MKYSTLLLLVICLASFHVSTAQIERINENINRLEAESHLRFLTADELRGRNTGTAELNIAGRYIAEQFRKSGLDPLGDKEGDFLQRVNLYTSTAPNASEVSMLDKEFTLGVDLSLINGKNGSVEAPLVYLTDLSSYEENEVEGKIVVTVLSDVRAAIGNVERIKLLKSAGAVGLVEIFGSGQRFPWGVVMNYLNREKMSFGDVTKDEALPHVWVNDTTSAFIQNLRELPANSMATLSIDGVVKTPVNTFNVVGKIEGTDPELKKEHLIMCAHYDHVGVQAGEGVDSIYNGTRDNGIGTTGLINAAKYFGEFPTKRSIIIIALTAEEKGLLGSQFYTDNPKIPLEESVFALNIDNSGYTNTEVFTLLDTGRTNIDPLVYQAASEVGLGVIGDRLPNQNYYERSDQVSFAVKGVPAVNFKMSMTEFDERITKYYHKPEDEFHTVDLDYIHKYWKAYIRTAELIGNWNERPYWMEGDKFESAGKKLYNMQ